MSKYTAPPSFTTRPTLSGTFGMAASTHWLATATAQAVLERGGNAFDAVVAGGFVLHVVEPHLNGPGGDLVGIFATGDDSAAPIVLMGQGPAPAGATIEHFRREGLDLVPGAGGLAAAVPGAVDAWLLLLRDHGTWELGDVLSYAIGYARDGHPLLPAAAATIARVAELFRGHWPTSAELWMPGGDVPPAGTVVRNTAYADVLDALVHASCTVRDDGPVGRAARIDAARHEWKNGLVAQAASRFLAQPHRHSSGGDHAAVITTDDFAGFDAGYEPAVTAQFRGHTVAKAGAWTQGPALLEALRILEPMPDESLDPSTELGAHTILETIKLVLADRDAYLGDGAVLGDLLSDAYAAQRRADLTESASREWRPGAVPGREPYRPVLRTSAATAAGTGEPTVSAPDGAPPQTPGLLTPQPNGAPPQTPGLLTPQPNGAPPQTPGLLTPQPNGAPPQTPGLLTRATGETRGDTCHIDVVDRWGNIVSVTPSGGWLQSSPTIPELGFCLGTRLQMMWLDETSPSALRPGDRPRTTLTPTLVLRDGQAIIALGTPGGDQQDQWQLPVLLRMLVGGYSGQQAIDAPSLHSVAMIDSFWPRTWSPAGAVVEDRLGDDVIAGLEARGHDVVRAGDWSLGRVSAVGREPATGLLWAAANARGMQGYAAGR